MNKKRIRALVLFSGGLDSILAAKVLMEQNIEVEGITFISNFFDVQKGEVAAKALGIKLNIVDITKDLIGLVKNPPSGHGRNLNPCIDCHALMIKKAAEFLKPHPVPLLETRRGDKEKKFDFIATGEVLGQRPFSQNKEALQKVMRLAGAEVLRPLSAKLLPETEFEKNGLVGREKLLDINGRGRKKQILLAKKYGISEYPSPGGGCLLTDPTFSRRLREMLTNWPEISQYDINFIKSGRLFWLNLNNNGQIIKFLLMISRNEAENEVLRKLAKKGDFMLELKEIKGPVAILRIKNYELRITNLNFFLDILNDYNFKTDFDDEKSLIEHAGHLTGYYLTKARGKEVKVCIKII